MEKNYFQAISHTISFILKHPAVLVFTLLRLVLFGIIYVGIVHFYPAFAIEALIKNSAILFKTDCFAVVPCGLLVLYCFLVAGLEVGIATSRYVQAIFNKPNQIGFQGINFTNNFASGLFWSLILTPAYFYIFNLFMLKQEVAPLLYFLTPIPLLIMLLVLLPTFFLAPQITQGYGNVNVALSGALETMKANFGKTILFIALYYVLSEVGFLVLINAINTKAVLTQIIVGLLFAILVTVKDVFKTIVAAK